MAKKKKPEQVKITESINLETSGETVDGSQRLKLRKENKDVTNRLARIIKEKRDLAEAQDRLDKEMAYKKLANSNRQIGFIDKDERKKG